ncbi:MAG: VWA domain-containing protein [Candidatus Cloacimonetes bacterium]|nr:VWA domain-containing protein [Candidatus Cloacimonadota bacterium]
MLELVYPQWFWLLLLLIPLAAYDIFYKRKKRNYFNHSRLDLLRAASGNTKYLRFLSLGLRAVVIILITIALVRPRIANQHQQLTGKGIDIILALDVSGSMKAVDFQPVNRLEAAKKVAVEFIENRRNDRIGLVIFSEYAFTQCPLTLDYNILMTIMDDMKINETASGTAIGMGLATAVARLKDSEAKSRVIILITDGRNNTGEIDPVTAAKLAETFGIKVYAIGVGSRNEVDYPVQTAFGIRYQKVRIEVDMETLNQIAAITGTERARRAQNTAELKAIIDYIDQMEKVELKVENYYTYRELFWKYIFLALVILLLEFLFQVVFRLEMP